MTSSETLNASSPLISIVMGSRSDWPTMSKAAAILDDFQIPYEAKVVSAHRTPGRLIRYAEELETRGVQVVVAGAGGAAHLPGMIAAVTTVPVLGVPVAAGQLQGIDALLSICQMPKGVPVGTLAIGAPGAANAALLATSIVARNNPEVLARLKAFREKQTAQVPETVE